MLAIDLVRANANVLPVPEVGAVFASASENQGWSDSSQIDAIRTPVLLKGSESLQRRGLLIPTMHIVSLSSETHGSLQAKPVTKAASFDVLLSFLSEPGIQEAPETAKDESQT